MVGLNVSRPVTAAQATSIWHKLIPGAAISLQVLLESFLSATFDSTQCNGVAEAIFRTLAFIVSWGVGLKCMKWTFSSDENVRSPLQQISRRVKHALVNIGLVTSWLFAVSDFPLKCWLVGDSSKAISATRGVLMIVIQALAALEVFDIDLVTTNGDNDEEPTHGEVVANEKSGLL